MKKLLLLIFILQINVICFSAETKSLDIMTNIFTKCKHAGTNPVILEYDEKNYSISSHYDANQTNNKNSLILNMVAACYFNKCETINYFKPGNIWSWEKCPDYVRYHNNPPHSSSESKFFEDLSPNYTISRNKNAPTEETVGSFVINGTGKEFLYYLGFIPAPIFKLSYGVYITTHNEKLENSNVTKKTVEEVKIIKMTDKTTIHTWVCPLINYGTLISLSSLAVYGIYHKWFKK